jgi:DNA polymerase III subunit epsilon
VNKIDFDQITEIVRTGDFLVMDTETTGSRRPAEIVEIAVVNSSGMPLYNQRIKPVLGIPASATAIYGITEDAVANCPSWADVKPVLMNIIRGKNVLTYNATYDRHMLHCSDTASQLAHTNYRSNANWYCAMEYYAQYWGAFDGWHDAPKWQKLTVACYQQKIDISTFNAHGALADAQMTLLLLQHVAGQKLE